MQRSVRLTLGIAKLVWGLAWLSLSADVGRAQQSLPFVNDFTSTSFTNTTSTQWTLDAANGLLNYSQPAGGGAVIGIGSEQMAGLNSADFVTSTRFTLNDLQGTLNPIAIGFGAFASSSDLSNATAGNSYYLADWSVGGSGTGGLRVLKLVNGSPNVTIGTNGNGGVGEIGKTYELRLTGIHSGAELQLNLALFDDMGVQLGTAAGGADAAPLAGDYFGLRVRTAHPGHVLNAGFQDFRITAPTTSAQADFDQDNDVDGADFLIWQRGLGSAGGLSQGDADGDGMITDLDISIWKFDFGSTAATATTAAIPEPTSLVLLLGAICLIAKVATGGRGHCCAQASTALVYRRKSIFWRHLVAVQPLCFESAKPEFISGRNQSFY
jgi:hypothetical protein